MRLAVAVEGRRLRIVTKTNRAVLVGDAADASYVVQDGSFTLKSDATDAAAAEVTVTRGALLGASVNSQYASRQAQLRPGDIIVWYTDGLTESRDAAQKQYGTQRLAAAIQAHAHLSAEALRYAILADARAFSAGQPAHDDITVVVAEFASASP